MQYSPKLKKAMEEIKHILKRYDIAGVIALHAPGHGEHLNHVYTTYACTKPEGDNLRIRARLKEDFQGDKEAQIKKLTDTVNMFDVLSMITAKQAVSLIDVMEELKKILDIESRDGGFTSHTTQNN